MNNRNSYQKSNYKEESSGEEDNMLNTLESYIEASEMYLEALKLQDSPEASSAYVIGMSAVYFGKAHLALSDTDNTSAIKGSLREAMGAYQAAISFCETNNIGKQFVYTGKLVLNTYIQN